MHFRNKRKLALFCNKCVKACGSYIMKKFLPMKQYV